MVGGTAQLARPQVAATLTVGGSATLDSSAATRADFQLGDIGSGVSVVLGGSGDFSAGIVQTQVLRILRLPWVRYLPI